MKSFCDKANNIHNNKYFYPETYVNARTKLRIICPIHGEFFQLPSSHLSYGCRKCSFEARNIYRTKSFIRDSKKIHENKYDYSLIDTITSVYDKVSIICKKHGIWKQIVRSHLKGNGCRKCVDENKKITNKEFIERANNIHNNKYSYPDKYINSYTKIKIICPIHGEFFQRPHNHLQKQGCDICFKSKLSDILSLSTEEFIERANNIHKNKYDYSCVNYKRQKEKIGIICKKHGLFSQTAEGHLKGYNCPKCVNNSYSKKSISWLNEIAKKENIHIQHAENDGEYSIPSTRYKADGYCEKTNTIYEFYGDVFHGNLELYEEDEQCHPFSDECAGNLYMKTIQREQKIKKLGYNLVTIWERNFILMN